MQVRPATEAEDRIFSRLVQLDRFVADTRKQVVAIPFLRYVTYVSREPTLVS